MSSKSLKSLIIVCAALFGSTGTASAFGLTFEWGPTKKCFDPKSPPAKLVDVPKGTKKLRFKLTDLDAVGYPHGGDTISYAGKNSFPYGAFHYTGPCPPSPHTYMLSVEALDAGGKTLAKADARKRFP
ncbi:YbhB/YbcL family Raf kinase inhibitor-like protein [Mesorhizobium sp. BAC0120]|uniref:YbhB/YbcL family Raf kinase inhibitor-like protein n=1 Tax=Mesorhizobium sp. BAC0120 TaxID=3090670 RepID=UPI00298C49C3|nr:YbhB/YbcL family Raf kinase inhibitor-like protein [Mesorhizobium sp. BAC0120]MDW6023979.1 YbhB/YbcL family Raf kinase inhibitor-like protein [Mesorhizobium sp. BAC0120]